MSLGFRVKTGRAIVVTLAGSARAPQIVDRRELQLCDPEVPASRQPYHATFQPFVEAEPDAVRRASQAARRVALAGIRALDRELGSAGFTLAGIGIVVTSNPRPERIANPHIRAHASEGLFFQRLVEEGAQACGVASRVILERELLDAAARTLGRPTTQLEHELAEMKKKIGRPWRAEERAAALAAWIALTPVPHGKQRPKAGSNLSDL